MEWLTATLLRAHTSRSHRNIRAAVVLIHSSRGGTCHGLLTIARNTVVGTSALDHLLSGLHGCIVNERAISGVDALLLLFRRCSLTDLVGVIVHGKVYIGTSKLRRSHLYASAGNYAGKQDALTYTALRVHFRSSCHSCEQLSMILRCATLLALPSHLRTLAGGSVIH